MINKNELIFVNKILSSELTIRKAAKQLELRRDDLIKRIKEMLKDDEENTQKLDIVILFNKILFDNLQIKEAAKKLKITEKELDKYINNIFSKNKEKIKIYEQIKYTSSNCYNS